MGLFWCCYVNNATKNKRRLAGTALVAFTASVVLRVSGVLTEPSEGKRNRPYYDPAHYLTVCYGETQGIEDRIYDDAECVKRLRAQMALDYAPIILACVSDFADPAHAWAYGAALDASYNTGASAFCRSPIARAFNAGDWIGGCRKFLGWRVTARGQPLRGLLLRRSKEGKYCLTGQLT